MRTDVDDEKSSVGALGSLTDTPGNGPAQMRVIRGRQKVTMAARNSLMGH